ncbi:MAG: ABC transporter substrate-binding protein [Anaerolineae bacterium]|nr:ABC transporter substrate-binding protein [Thermoflexales bacterium]MDW8406822.1 ABC transporter substrate-binding protein [Anaerolineae bacterium]
MKQRIGRRQFLRVTAGGSAMALYLAACAGAPQQPAQPAGPAEQPAAEKPAEGAPAPAAEKITLVRYASMEKDHFPLFEAQRNGFNKLYPNVTVEEAGVPWGEYIAKVRVLLNSGEVPDVFWFMRYGQWDPGIEAATYMKEEIIAPANEVLNIQESKHFENIVEAGKVDGKLVGIPFEVFSNGVNWMYNLSILERTGLTPLPQNPTWDELDAWYLEAQGKVADDEFAMGPGSWEFWGTFMSASADQPGFCGMVDVGNNKCIIDTDANAATISKLAKFYKTHILARGDAAPGHLDGMLGGKVLGAAMSTWAPTQMNQAPFQYTSHSAPRQTGVDPRIDGFTGVNWWCFGKESKHIKEASEFCLYCGAQEGLDFWVASGRFAPTFKYTVDDYVKFGQALNQIGNNESGFRAAMTTNFDVVPHLQVWPIPEKAYWGQVLTKLNEVLKPVVEGTTVEQAEIKTLLAQAQIEVQKVLDGESA